MRQTVRGRRLPLLLLIILISEDDEYVAFLNLGHCNFLHMSYRARITFQSHLGKSKQISLAHHVQLKWAASVNCVSTHVETVLTNRFHVNDASLQSLQITYSSIGI